ncbi:accessory Sec system glycosyltransferase Asp1 [Lacticaseibacillus jixianensis]|uniref:Accessory Sec system glycosyltransferase Asp1 n=1 Tax=Lacticaseibacillus jixianensis TaxID=2486012 RepID=A0ABW4BAB9_9LACO|nr:accessory Sec system glycosyltransferase Asp1 [Lacticaseibacillus jixianensis]
MDYFIEGTLNINNTVIEKAAIKRLEVFQKIGRPARLVLLEYSPQWALTVNQDQQDSVVGLFDHIQKAEGFTGQKLTLNGLDARLGYYDRTPLSKARTVDYTDGDRLVARVHVIPGGAVDTVTYVGAAEQTLETDRYDARGFLSRRQFWYGGRRTHEEYLSPAGTLQMEVSFNDDGKEIGLIRLIEPDQHFFSMRALIEAYVQQELGEASALVCDRRNYDWLLASWPAQQRFQRLYNSAPTAAVPEAVPLARKSMPTLPAAVVIDEYRGEAQRVVDGWRQVLVSEGERGDGRNR